MRQSTANAPVYILSVSQAHLTDASNEQSASDAQAYFADKGIDYKVVQGCYKGKRETSYVLGAQHKASVRVLAGLYNQESVLFLDADRSAFLRYLTDWDKEVYAGQFQSASKAVATLQDGYTHDEQADIYYIINK